MAKKKKSATSLTSYSKILNIGYGVLNPIRDTLTSKNFDPLDVTPIDLVRNSYKAFYSPRNFTGAGPFIGIVLRDDGTTKQGIVDPSSWVSGPFAYALVDEEEGGIAKEKVVVLPELKQLRVRIPEVHAGLAIPKYLPTKNQIGKDKTGKHDFNEDHLKINQYPVFVAQNERISALPIGPGDLVWVDFQNTNTLEGGIYLGPVNEKQDVKTSVTHAKVGGGRTFFSREKCREIPRPPECEVYRPTGIDYSDADLKIYPGRPVIIEMPPFDISFVSAKINTTINKKQGAPEGSEGTVYTNNTAYTEIVTHMINPKHTRTNRVKHYAYGLVSSEQVDATSGFVHKLLTPRLEALNKLWGKFFEAFGAGKFLSGETELKWYNFYIEQISNYSPKFELSRTSIQSNEKYAVLTAEKMREYLIEKVAKKETAGGGKTTFVDFSKIAYPGLSPHSTGLAFDIKGNGLGAGSATRYGYDNQKPSGVTVTYKENGIEKTKQIRVPQFCSVGYLFMLKYGWLFGMYPYEKEAWHWEVKVPRNCWSDPNTEYAGPLTSSGKLAYRQKESSADIPGFEALISNQSSLAETYDEAVDVSKGATPEKIKNLNQELKDLAQKQESEPMLTDVLGTGEQINAAIAAIGDGIPTDEGALTLLRHVYEQYVEQKKLESVDVRESITALDLFNNDIIIPQDELRKIYKEEFEQVYGKQEDDYWKQMKFPYAIWVTEKEDKYKLKSEASSMPGSTKARDSFLEVAGLRTGPPSWTSDAGKQAILDQLNGISIDPSKTYFSMPYFNTKGITDKTIRDNQTEATK